MFKKIIAIGTYIKNFFSSNKDQCTNVNANKKIRKAGKVFVFVAVGIMFITGLICLFLDGNSGCQYSDNFVKVTGAVNILLTIIASGVASSGIIKKLKGENTLNISDSSSESDENKI